jgi:hypothetical protein
MVGQFNVVPYKKKTKLMPFKKKILKKEREWKKPLHIIMSDSVYTKDSEKWNFIEHLNFWRTDKTLSFMSGI